jgi:DNA end-binding protein Ku
MARSIWWGSISCGLVTVPEKSGRAVDYGKLKKGYETSKGSYAVFDQDELKELAPPSTKTIDIEDFVPLDDIDPIYFQRTYHLAPANDAAAHPYALLATVMEQPRRVAVPRGRPVRRVENFGGV